LHHCVMWSMDVLCVVVYIKLHFWVTKSFFEMLDLIQGSLIHIKYSFWHFSKCLTPFDSIQDFMNRINSESIQTILNHIFGSVWTLFLPVWIDLVFDDSYQSSSEFIWIDSYICWFYHSSLFRLPISSSLNRFRHLVNRFT